MMAKYFYEYSAVQERTANGPRRIIECEHSGMDAVKIPGELGQRIVDALNVIDSGAVNRLVSISESDLHEVEKHANEMEDCSVYGGGIIKLMVLEIRRLGEIIRYNQGARLIHS